MPVYTTGVESPWACYRIVDLAYEEARSPPQRHSMPVSATGVESPWACYMIVIGSHRGHRGRGDVLLIAVRRCMFVRAICRFSSRGGAERAEAPQRHCMGATAVQKQPATCLRNSSYRNHPWGIHPPTDSDTGISNQHKPCPPRYRQSEDRIPWPITE